MAPTAAPPTALLLKRAAGVTSGSGRSGTEVAGTVSLKHLYQIAQIKLKDVQGVSEEAVSARARAARRSRDGQVSDTAVQMCRTIAGSARSMGLRIVR